MNADTHPIPTERGPDPRSRPSPEQPPRRSRRHFLAGAGSALLPVLAGCLGNEQADPANAGDRGDDPNSSESAVDWGGIRGDPSLTGRRPAAHGPGDSLSIAWVVSVVSVLEEIESRTFEVPDTEPDGLFGIDEIIRARHSPPVLAGPTVLWTVVYRLSDGEDAEATNDSPANELPPPDRASVVAADQATGELLWDHSLEWAGDRGIEQPLAPVVGPLGVYTMGVTTAETHIDVLDPETGTLEDRFPSADTDIPLQPVVADGTIYYASFSLDGGTLHAVDARDGTLRWSEDHPLREVGWGPWPLVTPAHDRLWSVDIDEEATLLGRDPADGSVQTEIPMDLPAGRVMDIPTSAMGIPVIEDGTAYLAGGFEATVARDRAPLVAVDLETETVEWTYEPPSTPIDMHEHDIGAAYGFPLVLDDVVVVHGVGAPEDTPDSKMYLLGVGRDSGELDWAMPGALDPRYPPVAAGNTVYAPTLESDSDGGFSAITAGGAVTDTVAPEPPVPMTGPPAVGGERLCYSVYHSTIAIE